MDSLGRWYKDGRFVFLAETHLLCRQTLIKDRYVKIQRQGLDSPIYTAKTFTAVDCPKWEFLPHFLQNILLYLD